MKEGREFQARLLHWAEVHELPDGWTPGRFQELLTILEVDGVPDDEAGEMALLALQDFEPDQAAEKVLEVVFGDTMRTGVKKNLAHDLTEEAPWDDFADISRQAGIFEALVLLQAAFPRAFDKPDAVAARISLDTASEKGRSWLDAATPDPALLLRILGRGMTANALLLRLYGEALAGSRFPEAGSILWHVSARSTVESGREFTLIASHQWFDPLEDLVEWTAMAWPDAKETSAPPED